MTTDVDLATCTLTAMPSSSSSTTDECSDAVFHHHQVGAGRGDIPSPLMGGNHCPVVSPGSMNVPLQRRFSAYPQSQELSSRYRSPSGDSGVFGMRSSPLTNITFLEDYEKEEIGRGFFATVFKVQHRFTGQVLAAKINTRSNNWDNVQHEIQLMSRLSHPSVIRFMGLVIHDGNLHPLLEFINGGTMSDLLCDNQIYLSWSVRIGLASDISGAMAYLHKKAYMHRDLTSSNVLIRRTGLDIRAVVCDFGLSCRFPRELSGLTTPVGTPFWMAPECLNFKPYDEKADVFSFGIILCEIIARVTADPEELPRLKNFGLDEEAFKAISGTCPEPLLELSFTCCQMNKCRRPMFVDIEFQLQHIKIKLGRKGRSTSDKATGGRSRRHTVYLNVPDVPNSTLPPQQTKKPLVRSNSDRGARDRRLSSRQKMRTNPFDTPALKGGKTKFVNSGRDHLKQLSPDMSIDISQVLSTIFGRPDVMSLFEEPVERRLSVSLPSSPELHRRDISFDEDEFFDDLMSWPSSSDTFEPYTGRTPPPPEEPVPPPPPPLNTVEQSRDAYNSNTCTDGVAKLTLQEGGVGVGNSNECEKKRLEIGANNNER